MCDISTHIFPTFTCMLCYRSSEIGSNLSSVSCKWKTDIFLIHFWSSFIIFFFSSSASADGIQWTRPVFYVYGAASDWTEILKGSMGSTWEYIIHGVWETSSFGTLSPRLLLLQSATGETHIDRDEKVPRVMLRGWVETADKEEEVMEQRREGKRGGAFCCSWVAESEPRRLTTGVCSLPFIWMAWVCLLTRFGGSFYPLACAASGQFLLLPPAAFVRRPRRNLCQTDDRLLCQTCLNVKQMPL